MANDPYFRVIGKHLWIVARFISELVIREDIEN